MSNFAKSLRSVLFVVSFASFAMILGCGGGSTGATTTAGSTSPGTPGATTAGANPGTSAAAPGGSGTTTGGGTGSTAGAGSGTTSGSGSGTVPGGTGTPSGGSSDQYTMLDLSGSSDPDHVGAESPFAINAAGEVTGDNDTGHAFLYQDGKVSRIPEMSGFTFSSAHGINSAKQVVGSAWFMNGEVQVHHAFIYTTTTGMQDINFQGGTSEAEAINSSGQIAGWSIDTGGSKHAVIYSSGQTRDLGPGIANAINDPGDVAGNLSLSGGAFHAFIYHNGQIRDLGTLGGANSSALGINAGSQVVGDGDLDPSHRHAFIYDSSSGMKDLGSLQGADGQSTAFGINAAGQVVGTSSFDRASLHAFIYKNGSMKDLNDLVPSGSGATLSEALAINDAGQITASGIVGNQTHAFLLTPKQ